MGRQINNFNDQTLLGQAAIIAEEIAAEAEEILTVAEKPEEPEEPVKTYVRGGYINAKDFLLALKESIRTNNYQMRDYLLSYVDCLTPSYLNVALEVEERYEEEMRAMNIRVKATLFYNTLRNNEDFSPEDVHDAYEELRKVCHGDTKRMTAALADVR